jgi:hypothetical protein
MPYLARTIALYGNAMYECFCNVLILLNTQFWHTFSISKQENATENAENERKKMKWLEIIELRSATGNKKLLESQLETLINEVHKEIKKRAINVYNHAMIDTDFSIHLCHDSKKVEIIGSQLGLRLASALEAFGLVNHSIWIEMHNK